jgi:adenylate cyclase
MKTLLLGAGLFLFILAAVTALDRTGWLEGPENFYQDLWHQLAGKRYNPEHVVIVAVDEETLEAHAEEPLVTWTPHWARAIQVLREVGVRALGLDYLFRVTIESWLKNAKLPAGEAILNLDRPFKEQLASGQVVLAGRLRLDDQGRKTVVLPVPEFVSVLPRLPAQVGLINLAVDADGAVRFWMPALKDDQGTMFLTFPYLLALHWLGLDPVEEIKRLRKEPQLPRESGEVEGQEAFFRIGFAGPPDTFPRLSFERLLVRGALQDPKVKALRGKVVILAYEPPGHQDMHLTPYSRGFWWWEGKNMSGAEIHANIVETWLTGRRPREVPWPAAWFTGALFLGLGLLGYLRWSLWQAVVALSLLTFLSAVLGYGLFLRYWLYPVAPVHLSLILGFVGVLGLRLTREERERARLRRIFSRYVSEEVLEKLLVAGERPRLGGESCRVTVLFSDIRNFTTISEILSPDQVVEVLNTYFSRACEPILAAGGTVDKFVGDAVMAVFGAPVPSPDHARRAVQAALGLVQVARDFKTWMAGRFPEISLPPFQIGVGLHTGEAVVGIIGSPKRLEYTAIGDTVNTASRLEGLSKELGWTIVASRDTLEMAGPGLIVGATRVIPVKGRREPVEVSEILDISSEG